MDWKEKRCIPCEGGVPKVSEEQAAEWLKTLSGWEVRGDRLHKTLTLKDFRAAMSLLNQVAEVAEEEGHHPDFCVHYNRIEFTVWTHAIGGLSENDFILAGKIDSLSV
jgi:4a-hydroxytetrahydrobiopterin dehydratase